MQEMTVELKTGCYRCEIPKPKGGGRGNRNHLLFIFIFFVFVSSFPIFYFPFLSPSLKSRPTESILLLSSRFQCIVLVSFLPPWTPFRFTLTCTSPQLHPFCFEIWSHSHSFFFPERKIHSVTDWCGSCNCTVWASLCRIGRWD